MIAPVLARLLVGGVENQLVDGLGHGVAPPSWRRFLSEGKQSRLEASVFCSAGILPAFSESAAGWKPPLRNSSVPTQGQSRKPAFCGFSWTYRMILDSDASLRTKWSKYSRCQKPPERPKGGSPPGRKTISRNAEWLLTCVLRVWKTPHARDSASHTTPAPGSASHENAGSHRPQFWRFESRAYNTRPVRCRDSALPFAARPAVPADGRGRRPLRRPPPLSFQELHAACGPRPPIPGEANPRGGR